MLRIRITVLILAVTLGFSAQAGRVVVDPDGNRYDLQSKDHEECAVDVCCNGNECSNPSSCCDKELHCMVTEVQKRDNLGNVYLSKKGKCGVEKQLEKIRELSKNLLQRQYRASDFQNPSVKTHLRQNQGAAASLAGP